MVQRVSPHPKPRPRFIEPMECRLVSQLPDGENWIYEPKQDGYRAVAVIDGPSVFLYSMAGEDYSARFPHIVFALKELRLREAVLDGEVIAEDENGRASFSELQHWQRTRRPIVYYVFDLLHLAGKDLLSQPLDSRKQQLAKLAARFERPLLLNPYFKVPRDEFLASARQVGLEGVVAKRANSIYEPGKRSDAWQKIAFHLEHQFIIGGYMPGGKTFASLLVGFDYAIMKTFPEVAQKAWEPEFKKYGEDAILYMTGLSAGFLPHQREEVYDAIKALKTRECPFANLPERRSGTHVMNAEKTRSAVWL
ncbi:MAG: ATP-dependent DNA ligase, partial [Terriglobales bacterium]